ncbi:MAG TPA: PAS domain S-box protein [Acidobacteriota bacterium]|nr:PAS domain S-box protein [Acidobacteriota bacterium]
MRADSFTFKDVFQVESLSGRINLGSNRHIVLDTAAIGAMRHELMDNLGWDVSRGVFMRIGYQSGRHDARQLRKHYPLPSDQDLLLAGLRLSYLEGMAKARLDECEVDRGAGKINIKGEWLDSFEVEYHLQQYGIGNRSACWTLEGYGSGFASEILGLDVICSETHCRAKGDPACKFEFRSADDWGEAARPIQEILTTGRFTERFDRCLRIIGDMGCELEQTSLDAVFTTDAHGAVTSCSQGASDILGTPPSEAIGKQVSSFYAGGSSEAHSIMERLKEQKRFRDYLTEFVTPGGRRTPVILSASAIRNRLGDLVGTIGVAHDLSKIRRLEDELAKKNRFMANILRDSADAIITMDPNDIVTSWNKGAERIFGYLASEMIGKPVSTIVPPELREARELESISRTFKAQGAVRSHQTERITKDGRRIQVIFTRTAIRDDSGQIVGSSSVVKDVTSFRNLEKQLADAEHLATLGELSAGLAHEIKNPLAGIKGAIDVIRHTPLEADKQHQILGDVIHEVNRIDKIVRDLLNYAKPKPASHSAIDLPALVHSIVAIAGSTSKRGSSPIQVCQLAPIPEFTGDETQLEQVVLNLLLNAQHAISSGGHIEVVLDYNRDAATVRMEVRDDGRGIPESIRKKIFQPFFTTRTDGVGLGLATCLKNVQYHGGTIEVRSGAGRGTTFAVSIPLFCYI